ncbi:uncharacterized protein LOC143522184 isoform X2 [Brachyhypopomus gauderio]|uniref:uncharacterized protein LOC143522184 isoform X2 n=1 Tax=Brachyhypopomus gauderio TaxID=698409 RepID=UPI00404311D8
MRGRGHVCTFSPRSLGISFDKEHCCNMSSRMTLQSPKPGGTSPRNPIGDTSKHRTGLLQDNSWIKRQTEDDDIVEVDTNYGKGVLDVLKTQTNSESETADSSQPDPVSPPSTSVSSLAKRFNMTKEVSNKSSPAPKVPNKPPVTARKPAPTPPSPSFTARVFSGANSTNKVFTPVKKSVDEKTPQSNESTIRVTSGTPLSPGPKSPSPQPHVPLFNDSTAQSTTTTTVVTTLNSATDKVKIPSNTQDSFAKVSESVYTSPVSPKSSPPNILSTYKSPQSVYDTGNTQDSFAKVSESVYTSPVSPKSSPPNILSTYKSPQSVYDTGVFCSNTQDSFAKVSESVYTSPVSLKSSAPNILSYKSPQSVYDTGNTQDSFAKVSESVYTSPASLKSSAPNILSYKSPQSVFDTGTESETTILKPSSRAGTSARYTTTTFTIPEETLPSPVATTDTYSQSWDQSNDNTGMKATITTTTTTILNSATDNVKIPSDTEERFADAPFSPSVYTSPVSLRSSPPNILSYKSSQSVFDTGTESETTFLKPSSRAGTSARYTTTTFTIPEETLPSPVATTDTYSQSWDQSLKSSPPNILSYKSPQSVFDTGTTFRQTSDSQTPTTPPTLYSSTTPQYLYSSTTPQNLYSSTTPQTRIVGKRDLCSFCAKSITGGDRMILEELQIISHLSCFKCELCQRSLGSLEAGDTLWVYRGQVHCNDCYKRTNDQWFR